MKVRKPSEQSDVLQTEHQPRHSWEIYIFKKASKLLNTQQITFYGRRDKPIQRRVTVICPDHHDGVNCIPTSPFWHKPNHGCPQRDMSAGKQRTEANGCLWRKSLFSSVCISYTFRAFLYPKQTSGLYLKTSLQSGKIIYNFAPLWSKSCCRTS